MGTGQNPPPDKTPLRPKPPSGKKKTLWPIPPSCKNPPLAKTPSDKKPPPVKIKHLVNPPPLLPLFSNEYYESYKPTTLINCKLPNLLLLYW